MTLYRAFAIILTSAFLVGCLGAGVGYAVGVRAPGYYRGLSSVGREPGFDPVGFGVGSGLTQGTAGGVVVGVALVAIFSWREARLRGLSLLPTGPLRASRPITRQVFWASAGLLALGFCMCFGVFVGTVRAEELAKYRLYVAQRAALEPALVADPAFARVEIYEYSAGGVYLSGEVSNAADRGRLRECVARAIGSTRIDEVMSGVGLKR